MRSLEAKRRVREGTDMVMTANFPLGRTRRRGLRKGNYERGFYVRDMGCTRGNFQYGHYVNGYLLMVLDDMSNVARIAHEVLTGQTASAFVFLM
jgi:hypothetical protein